MIEVGWYHYIFYNSLSKGRIVKCYNFKYLAAFLIEKSRKDLSWKIQRNNFDKIKEKLFVIDGNIIDPMKRNNFQINWQFIKRKLNSGPLIFQISMILAISCHIVHCTIIFHWISAMRRISIISGQYCYRIRKTMTNTKNIYMEFESSLHLHSSWIPNRDDFFNRINSNRFIK